MFDINEFIGTHGATNVRVQIPLRPLHSVFGIVTFTESNDPEFPVICRPVFSDRYPEGSNYKINFEPELTGFGNQSFYVSDFNRLVARGIIRVFVEFPETA